MKLTALTFAMALAASAYSQTPAPNPAAATVNQVAGFYLFTDSRPTAPFVYLGTIEAKPSKTKSEQYTDIKNALIKAARSQYPSADGLIFTFITGRRDQAEVIKFQ